MLTYEPRLKDVLRLNWKTQPLGKRAELLARLAVVTEYIIQTRLFLEEERGRIQKLDITKETARERKKYNRTLAEYKRALRAKQTIENELERRIGASAE